MNRPLLLSMLTALTLSVAAGGTAAASDFPSGSPAFLTNYDSALAAAKESGKPVVMIFSASWCPPCQANKKNVYPSAAVRAYHDRFIWAYLDADEPANVPAMQRFGVSGIPHIQFLKQDGSSIGHLVGGTSPEEFVTVLQKVLREAKA